ncbi:MAG: S-adenosylmethionine:tRNA ribosyltransferase-isomerase [Muribaculaceae bacterium]|nr:S-adenosylmethionine:tRNA ribosyltransferase-isomerase [Muribaculaceae bacterium]
MTPQQINIADYNYPLPQDKIALHPLPDRAACKLLHRTADGEIRDLIFRQLPEILPPDAMLVYNNTRVINARLHFRKESGASIEIFCLEPHAPADYERCFASTSSCSWLCFVGNSKRWRDGELALPCPALDTTLKARRQIKTGNASMIEFSWDRSDVTFSQLIEALGEIPVPPYLNRPSEESDTSDYQTVYSRIEGSVAAPTAGLHFTPEILDEISARGIPRIEVTLHVGAGTFQPVKSDTVGEHTMHSEFIAVGRDTIQSLLDSDRPVYAVGTTTVRTIESLYHAGCLIHSGQWQGEIPQWYPYSDNHPHLNPKEALKAVIGHLDATGSDRFLASTRIIIAPGYDYRMTSGLITNFHQPQSTLLLLVSAMIGEDWKRVYTHALECGYRFLSYGDACLFEKNLIIKK